MALSAALKYLFDTCKIFTNFGIINVMASLWVTANKVVHFDRIMSFFEILQFFSVLVMVLLVREEIFQTILI